MVDTKPRDLMFALIAFTALVLGGLGLITEFEGAKSNFSDTPFIDDSAHFRNFSNTLDQSEALLAQIDTIKAPLSDTVSWDQFGAFALLETGWRMFKALPSMLLLGTGFVASIFSGVSNYFGVPAWVATLALSFITVMIVFSIFTAVFQREL